MYTAACVAVLKVPSVTPKSVIAVTIIHSGLAPSTTYYFQLVATAGANNYPGTVRSFTTTSSSPQSQTPVVATGPPERVGPSGALLTGDVHDRAEARELLERGPGDRRGADHVDRRAMQASQGSARRRGHAGGVDEQDRRAALRGEARGGHLQRTRGGGRQHDHLARRSAVR